MEFQLYDVIDFNKSQVIGIQKTILNVVETSSKEYYQNADSGYYNKWQSSIKGIMRFIIIYIDTHPSHPTDCIYNIKVIDQNMTGKRTYSFGMDWDDNSEDDNLDTFVDWQLALEFSIYNTMDTHQDFYTQLKLAFIDTVPLIEESDNGFQGVKAKKTYVLHVNLLLQKFLVPPKMETEQKACSHISHKKRIGKSIT